MLRKLLVTLLFLFPVTAFAKINPSGLDAWTIYAFGNAQVLGGIIQASKGMMNTGYFTTLIAFVAVLTVIIASTMSVQGGLDGKRIAGMVFAITAMATIGVQEKSDVYIHDPVFGDHVMVQDVPAIVAIPASFVTTMGHRITEMLETHFTTPDALSLSGGGAFNLSNTILASSTKLEIRSPYLKSSINKFTNDCLIPSVAMGWVSSNEILNSTNLWGTNGTFSNVNPALFTVVYSGNHKTGLVVPCREAGMPDGEAGITVSSVQFPSVNAKGAFEYISNYIEAAAVPWMAEQTRTIGKEEWLANTINSAQKYIFGVSSYDTTKSLEQSAAVNAMRPIIQGLSAQLGQEASTMGFAVAQAEISQRNSWAMSAILFQDMAGYAYSVLQAFIIGLTPIMFVMMLLPGGLKVAKNYGAILLWLALWEPTLAIVNYVIQLYSIGSLGMLGDGYTMTNMALLDTRTSNFILAASALAAAVPMITWAIIKGGNAFTSYIAGGIGTQFANKAAETATSANRDYGNVSTHNKTLDQEMMAMRTVAGNAGVTSQWSGFQQDINFGGIGATAGGQALQNQITSSYEKTSGAAHKLTETAQTMQQQGYERAAAQMTSIGERLTTALSTANTGSNVKGDSQTYGASQTGTTDSSITETDTDYRDKSKSFEASGGVGLTVFGMGGQTRFTYTDRNGERHELSLKEASSWANSGSIDERAERSQALSNLFTEMADEVKSVDESLSNSLRETAATFDSISKASVMEKTAQEAGKEAVTASKSGFKNHAEAEAIVNQLDSARSGLEDKHQELLQLGMRSGLQAEVESNIEGAKGNVSGSDGLKSNVKSHLQGAAQKATDTEFDVYNKQSKLGVGGVESNLDRMNSDINSVVADLQEYAAGKVTRSIDEEGEHIPRRTSVLEKNGPGSAITLEDGLNPEHAAKVREILARANNGDMLSTQDQETLRLSADLMDKYTKTQEAGQRFANLNPNRPR